MITKRCIIVTISLINCVVGTINVNNFNTTEAESKIADLEVKINQTLNKYVNNILDSFLTYIDDKTDALSQKIPELEQKITQQLNATNKNIEQNIELKINQTLNASNKQTEENLFEKITQMLNASNTKIFDAEEKITQMLNASNTKIFDAEEKITQMLNASNTKILDAEEKITQSIIASNTKVDLKLEEIKKELLENKRIMSAQLPCKELSFVHDGVSQYYSIDSDTLNHVTLKRNSSGHLQYFEMHLAIEADGWVEILLSQNKSSSDVNRYELRNLEFGKEGDVSSIVSTETEGIGFVNYFRFKLNGSAAKVRYDCPAPIRGLPLPCKEMSVVYNDIGGSTRYYSMGSDILHHVTLKRNSTGHLAHFEMHFAIKGDKQVVISLQDELQSDYNENNRDPLQFQLWIGYESSKSTTTLKLDYSLVKQVRTANNLLSSTQFRLFYIKIDNGNLQFGKEGDSSPLLSHDDARLGLVNFFKLNMHRGPGTIRYDCPAPVADTATVNDLEP